MTPASVPPMRTPWVDELRGLAVIWMVIFHFCFDLAWLGFARFDLLGDPWWTTQRTLIVSMFLGTAGLSQVLAWRSGQSGTAFWRRWSQIAGCAVLVSVSSYFIFGASWIYFGVLHAVAVMVLLVRVALPLVVRWWVWGLIGFLIVSSTWWMPTWLQAGFAPQVQVNFNNFPMNVLGWVSKKPLTEDYVPLAPWLGVMCWGIAFALWRGLGHAPATAAGNVLTTPELKTRTGAFSAANPLAPGGSWRTRLAWVGRHSLLIYMIHQPLLVAGLQGVRALS